MIKKINAANAGVKRPLRVSDLQDLWSSISLLQSNDDPATPRILWGFMDKGDGYLSSGLVVKDSLLYYHADTAGNRIAIGAVVYGNEVANVDLRVFDDDTTQDFSFNMVASITTSGVALGTFTLAYIANHKKSGGYREVTGTITFKPSPFVDELTFTPDDAANDSDIEIAGATFSYSKLLAFKIVDGDGNSMKRNFTAMLEYTSDVAALLSLNDLPQNIMTGDSSSDDTMLFRYRTDRTEVKNHVASYRVKILFDV